jgi:L-asparaginase II
MLQTIAEFAGLTPDDVHVGVDGCSVCTFGISVHAMATSFARLAQPEYWPEPRRSAVRRITSAMTDHPEMVAARRGRLDTDLMRAADGALIAKAGAEGAYCVAHLGDAVEPSAGFAHKLLDGDVSGRARNPAVVEGLRQAGFLTEDSLNRLEQYWLEEVRNRPGDVVGMIRPAFTLSATT